MHASGKVVGMHARVAATLGAALFAVALHAEAWAEGRCGSLVMAGAEINGPRMISDPDTELARNKPEKATIKFEETEDLAGLKEKYPRYKNN